MLASVCLYLAVSKDNEVQPGLSHLCDCLPERGLVLLELLTGCSTVELVNGDLVRFDEELLVVWRTQETIKPAFVARRLIEPGDAEELIDLKSVC